MKTHLHVRVDFSPQCSLGPGKVSLLEAIERSGSLSAAARELGMSYRRAWLLLHSLNDGFAEPAAELSVGGSDGGGARLTALGKRLIAEYRAFVEAATELAEQRFTVPVAESEEVAPASRPRAPRRAVNRSLRSKQA
ncbi:MAG: winged helix-turn-helix domain-containing protein [Nevskiaceae bacterium]|jgi:molybdate transport system regulatory protein|nr:winged helix-turn-helix domain-containing protein [Nevskiaceae bacterium]